MATDKPDAAPVRFSRARARGTDQQIAAALRTALLNARRADCEAALCANCPTPGVHEWCSICKWSPTYRGRQAASTMRTRR